MIWFNDSPAQAQLPCYPSSSRNVKARSLPEADFSSPIRFRWLAVTPQNPEPPPDRGSARSEAWRRLRSAKVPAETKLPIALKSQ